MRLSSSPKTVYTPVDQSDQHHAAIATPVRRISRWAWRAIGLMTALVAMAAVVGGLAWITVQMGVTQRDLLRWQEVVGRFRMWSVVAHVLVVMLVGWRWRSIVAWGQRKGIVKAAEYEQVLALRDKVLLFLAVYVLAVVIGPGTLAKLF